MGIREGGLLTLSLTRQIHVVHAIAVLFSLLILFGTPPAPAVVLSPDTDFRDLHLPGHEWYIYDVDQGGKSSIDVDSSDTPHISYRAGGMNGLRYASWKAGSWFIELVDDRDGAGHTSSMVLNGSDSPSIAYRSVHPHPDKGALMWTWWNGIEWTFEKLENNTNAGAQMSLDLDSDELPRISYVKRLSVDDDRQLWFAEKETNGTWNLTLLDSDGDLRYTSLFIDWRDWYHISYEELGDELRYALWNGSAWNIEKADTGHVGSWSSIKVDRDGAPHIGYFDMGRRMLKYATKINGSWNTMLVDDMSVSGPSISLDLDSSGCPHISYQSRDDNLNHAWWNGSAWLNETVDDNITVGTYSSMRIDGNDEIHISYFDRTRMMVKYATTKRLPIGGIETSIDIDPDTLNLKSKGKFITAYIELEGADVRDIDASSIRLNDIVSPVLDERYGFVTSEDSYIVDHDEDGVLERMVKFSRSEVQAILDVSLSVTITVTGQLFDGTPFSGTDEIRVIDPGELTKPKVADMSNLVALRDLPETHQSREALILVHFTSGFGTPRDRDPQQRVLLSPVAEPASSSILRTDERLQFWHRT